MFVAVVKSEPGWRACLVKHPSDPSLVSVEYWGIDLAGKPHPLDSTRSKFKDYPNFVCLLIGEPDAARLNELRAQCKSHAKTLGWDKE